MKKILFIFFVLIYSGSALAQIKQRSAAVSYYLGIGYKFVYLTNPTARDSYPFFQLSNGDFLKELDGVFGVTIAEKISVEFSPAYLFSNSLSSDGFYFEDNNGLRYYYPQQTRLFAVPLNLRIKFFPFAKNYTSFSSKLYFGGGGGGMYTNEEMSHQIYSDEGQITYLGARTYENDFWTTNFEFFAGVNSFSKIGFGFELSYRFVPLNQPQNKPLVTSLAGNLNSANLSANIIYTF